MVGVQHHSPPDVWGAEVVLFANYVPFLLWTEMINSTGYLNHALRWAVGHNSNSKTDLFLNKKLSFNDKERYFCYFRGEAKWPTSFKGCFGCFSNVSASEMLSDGFGEQHDIGCGFTASVYLPRKRSEIKYILREKSSLGYVNNIKRIISAFRVWCSVSFGKKPPSRQKFGKFSYISPLMRKYKTCVSFWIPTDDKIHNEWKNISSKVSPSVTFGISRSKDGSLTVQDFLLLQSEYGHLSYSKHRSDGNVCCLFWGGTDKLSSFWLVLGLHVSNVTSQECFLAPSTNMNTGSFAQFSVPVLEI